MIKLNQPAQFNPHQTAEFFRHKIPNQPSNTQSERKLVQFKMQQKNTNLNKTSIEKKGHILLKSRSDGPPTSLSAIATSSMIHPHPQPPVDFILKKPKQTVNYVQETCVRYLRPTTPDTPPGDIIIRQMADVAERSLPPLLIRQHQPQGSSKKSISTQEKLVIREAPPQLPPSLLSQTQNQIIMVQKKSNDQTSAQTQATAPSRKLIIYRQAPVAQKPPPIIVERWLPYGKIKRKVIFQKADGSTTTVTTNATHPSLSSTTSYTNNNDNNFDINSTSSLKNLSPTVQVKSNETPLALPSAETSISSDSDSIFTTLIKRIFSFIDKTDRGYIPLKEATLLFERFKDRLIKGKGKELEIQKQKNLQQRSVSDILRERREMPDFKNEKNGVVSFEEFKRCFLDYYKSETY